MDRGEIMRKSYIIGASPAALRTETTLVGAAVKPAPSAERQADMEIVWNTEYQSKRRAFRRWFGEAAAPATLQSIDA